MQRVKFLHCGDIHLDAPLTGSGLGAEQAALRRSELKETLGRIGQLAKAEQVELLFISGDLWEQGYVRKQTVTAVNELLGSLSPMRVFIAPGNHDPFLQHSFYQTTAWADNIHIFQGGPSAVELPELGTVVYGYGYENYETKAPVLRDLRAANQQSINFLVVHCQVVSGVGANSNYLPLDQQTIPHLGMDYLALGHVHQASKVIKTGDCQWAYPGSPEPLGFDELGVHGVIVGEITKIQGQAQISTTWVPLQKRRYYDLRVDISGAGTPEEVVALVQERVKETAAAKNRAEDFYRVTLQGFIDPDLVLVEQELALALAGQFFQLRLSNQSFPAYDLECLGKGLDLVGVYIRKMEALLALEVNGEQQGLNQEVINKALAYGLDALLKGEVHRR
ncbi:MAG: metallophosphoesterase family protein [Carboxydocellales bacterium]